MKVGMRTVIAALSAAAPRGLVTIGTGLAAGAAAFADGSSSVPALPAMTTASDLSSFVTGTLISTYGVGFVGISIMLGGFFWVWRRAHQAMGH